MDRYELGDRIGKGTYGTVFRARDKQGTDHVAVKTIELEDEEGIPSTAIREISLLKFLKHPNVINLHDVIHIYNKLYMVFELLELDLKHYIEVCPNGLQVITIKSLLYQLLQGLAYCHKQRILHRDLKPANLLLNRAGILKVADFGLARSFAMPISTLKHEVITLWYRAPELLLGSQIYSTEVDMWSVGCIFAEMLTSQPLFNGGTDDAQIDLIFKACGRIPMTQQALDDACDKVNALPHPSANPDAPANVALQQGFPTDFPPEHPNPSPDLSAYIGSLPLYSKYSASVSASGPQYHPTNILSLVPHIASKDPHCQDLLCKLLDLDPRRRISAEAAMTHPFFGELKHKQRRSSQHHVPAPQPPQQQPQTSPQPQHQQLQQQIPPPPPPPQNQQPITTAQHPQVSHAAAAQAAQAQQNTQMFNPHHHHQQQQQTDVDQAFIQQHHYPHQQQLQYQQQQQQHHQQVNMQQMNQFQQQVQQQTYQQQQMVYQQQHHPQQPPQQQQPQQPGYQQYPGQQQGQYYQQPQQGYNDQQMAYQQQGAQYNQFYPQQQGQGQPGQQFH